MLAFLLFLRTQRSKEKDFFFSVRKCSKASHGLLFYFGAEWSGRKKKTFFFSVRKHSDYLQSKCSRV